MWVIPVRSPRPDMPYWTGRRALAMVDAIAWPALIAFWCINADRPMGLFGAVVASLALIVALVRVPIAIYRNGRYRFTTWAVVRWIAFLLTIGLMLKLFVH